MKNLKLTQSLNQNVGIEIEETGLRPGTPGGPTCGQGALACWNCEICKIKDLFGELWNFRGNLGRKHNVAPPPPHSRTFSGKENVFQAALLEKGDPHFLIPPPPNHIPVGTALSVYTIIIRQYSLLNIKCLKN